MYRNKQQTCEDDESGDAVDCETSEAEIRMLTTPFESLKDPHHAPIMHPVCRFLFKKRNMLLINSSCM